MKRNKQASPSKATSANDTSNQAEASSGSSSSNSVSSASAVGAEDIQRLTSKNNSSPSKGYNLIGQLYNPNSAYQEQLLLTEQGVDQPQQQQQQEAPPTRLQTAPNRYSIAKLTSFLHRGPGMVGKGSSSGGDQIDGGEELLAQESVEASAKKVMKMSRNGNKNKENTNGHHPQNGNGAAGGGDDLESNSKSGANSESCKKSRCLLALLMGLIFIAAIVLTVLIFRPAINEDSPCKPQNSAFPSQLNTKLYATKTLYATTLNLLSPEKLYSIDGSPVSLSYHVPPTQALGLNATPPLALPTNLKYVPDSVTKPRIYISGQSLKTVHEKLIKGNGCVLKQFHFYGRHAARMPNEDGIRKINQTIEAIKQRLEVPIIKTASPLSDAIDAEQQTFTTVTSVPSPPPRQFNGSNKSNDECYDPMVELRKWKFFAEPDQSNLLTVTGGQEAASMAKRFKSIFPDLFDGTTANISFGTTGAIRTAQTAVHFLKEMVNYMPTGVSCTKEQFPVEGASDKSEGDKINGDICLKQFIEKSEKSILSFHEECENKSQGHITYLNHKLNVRDPQRTKFIAESVSKKLKLAKKNDKLTSEEVKAMYDVCRYESAITLKKSIWCQYFTDEHLKFYEYLADIQDYFESAYGDPNLALSACPITTSLFQSFKTYVSSHGWKDIPADYKPEVHFHFTHSEVLQRLIAASVDLTKDGAYTPANVLQNLERNKVPKDRDWQTSLLTPFSANIAFNLYECPRTPLISSQAIPFDAGKGTSPFKILASMNEQPIQMTGCDGYLCDYNRLLTKSRFFKHVPDPDKDTCDLTSYCQTKYVVQ